MEGESWTEGELLAHNAIGSCVGKQEVRIGNLTSPRGEGLLINLGAMSLQYKLVFNQKNQSEKSNKL